MKKVLICGNRNWTNYKTIYAVVKKLIDKYGKDFAGPIRNQLMLDDNPDIDMVIAFHSNLENSKGTKDIKFLVKKLIVFD